MKVLLTGADGLLGSNLIRVLLKREYQVRALILESSDAITIKDLPVEIIKGNILNYEDVLSSSKDVDYVIHCAANTSMFPARSEIVNKVNIDGTKNVIAACKANDVKRLIHVGTANSFGSGTLEMPGDETNSYEAGKYGVDYLDSKRLAQEAVLNSVQKEEIDAVVVNPTFMIGPYDSRPSSGELILGVYNKKVPGYTLGGKNWVAAKDVAVAVANAIESGKTGECYILGNENLTYKEAFDRIAGTLKSKPIKRKVPVALARTIGRFNSFLGGVFKFKPGLTKEIAILGTEEHYYSSDKAVTELGMPQTKLEVAVEECFEWFKANDYVAKN